MMKRLLLIGAGLLAATVLVQAVATYPSGIWSPSTRSDGQTIAASWFNTIHDEIVAIETALIDGFAHVVKPVADNTYDLGTSALSWRDGYFSRNVDIEGTLAVDGVVTAPMAYWTVVTTTATGTQSDFDPGIVGNTIVRANNASALTITGFDPATTQVAGQMVLVQAVNSTVTFTHQATSVAANQLLNIATSGGTPISTGGFALYVYDGTTSRWRLAAHEQGAWMTATFAEADFTGDTTDGNWTLDAGDRTTMAYRLSGRTLTVAAHIIDSDSANTPTTLRINNGQWGGFTATKAVQNVAHASDAGGAREVAIFHITASGTALRFELLDGGTFTATTSDNTDVIGELVFEVN